MTTEHIQHVSLPYLWREGSEERHICDNPGKAVESLDALGFCMNWGVAIPIGEDLSMLVYQGWIYQRTHERFVKLPFDASAPDFPEQFKELLERIFSPFLLASDVHHSQIDIVQHPTEADCYIGKMVLLLKGGGRTTHKQVIDALANVADSAEETRAKIFALD